MQLSDEKQMCRKKTKKESCKDDEETVWHSPGAPLTAVANGHASEAGLRASAAGARWSDRLQEPLIKVQNRQKKKPREMTSLSATDLNNLQKRLCSIRVCISHTDGG